MKPNAGQQSLAFPTAPVASPPAVVPVDDHPTSLARLRSRIGAVIVQFCTDRLASGNSHFRMAELDAHVRETVRGPIAPESVGRILRDLRQSKRIAYILVSRSGSEYEVIPT